MFFSPDEISEATRDYVEWIHRETRQSERSDGNIDDWAVMLRNRGSQSETPSAPQWVHPRAIEPQVTASPENLTNGSESNMSQPNPPVATSAEHTEGQATEAANGSASNRTHDHTYSTSGSTTQGSQTSSSQPGGASGRADPGTPGASSSASGTDGEPGIGGQRPNSELVLLQRHITQMQVLKLSGSCPRKLMVLLFIRKYFFCLAYMSGFHGRLCRVQTPSSDNTVAVNQENVGRLAKTNQELEKCFIRRHQQVISPPLLYYYRGSQLRCTIRQAFFSPTRKKLRQKNSGF